MGVLMFFFNDTATTEIYTLSLHDALPIYRVHPASERWTVTKEGESEPRAAFASREEADRKSTRLNSSHSQISYAVFCLKKKNFIRSRSHSTVVWASAHNVGD